MEEQFTGLLYKNQGIVHKICNLYFEDRADKEDCRQELIIQLWKAFPSFKNKSKFSTWMYRVCINAAIDINRKAKMRWKQVELTDALGKHDSDAMENTDFSNRDRLYMAIKKLSEIDRAIITLYLDEYRYQEIADIMGISKTNIGVKISRIKTELLKSFDDAK